MLKTRDEIVSQPADLGPKHALFSGLISRKESLETTSENRGKSLSEGMNETRDSELRDSESRDNEPPLFVLDDDPEISKELQVPTEQKTSTKLAILDSVSPDMDQPQQTRTEGTELVSNLIVTASELNTESKNSDNFSEKTNSDFLKTTKLAPQTSNTDLYQTTDDSNNPDNIFVETTKDLNTESEKSDDLFQANNEETNFGKEFPTATKLHNQSQNTSSTKITSDCVLAVTTQEQQSQKPNVQMPFQTKSHLSNSDNDLVLDIQNTDNDLVVTADRTELVRLRSVEGEGIQASSGKTHFEGDLVGQPKNNDEPNKQERNMTVNTAEQ